VVSGDALALIKRSLHTSTTTKIKIVASLLLAAGFLGTAARVLVAADAAPPAFAAAQAAEADAKSPGDSAKSDHVDALGDPLPPGAVARLGTLRWRHSSSVTFVAYAADSKHVITVTSDGAIRVLEATTGKELRTFGKIVDIGEVEQMQDDDIGDVARDSRIVRGDELTTVALSPDTKTVLVAHMDRSFTLWDVASGKEVKSFKPNTTREARKLVFAPDGKSFFASGYDNVLRHYDLANGREIRKFDVAHGSWAIAPDGKTVYSADQSYNNNDEFHAVLKSWDVETGKERPVIKGPDVGNEFHSMVLAPDAKHVVWSRPGGIVHVWDMATGKEVSRLTPPQNHVGSVVMALSPDGRTLAAWYGDQSVRLWNVADGKERMILEATKGTPAVRWGPSNLAFSPDGKLLASNTRDHSVRQWDVGTGKEVAAGSGRHHGPVTHLALSPDGKSVLTRAGDRILRQWDVATGKVTSRHNLSPALHASFSADSKVLVLGAFRGMVTIWDTAAGKELKQWKAGNDLGVYAVALSPDGKMLAVRDYQEIRLWDVGTARELRLGSAAADKGPAVIRVWFNYTGSTNNVIFSSDGTLLAGIGIDREATPNTGSTLRLWDVSTGKQIGKSENNVGIAALAFAPNDRTIATASSDGSVTLWESASCKARAQISFKAAAPAGPKKDAPAPPRPLVPGGACIAYSPDGKLLASTGDGGVVWICDAATGRLLSTLKGHQLAVTSLAFAANGKLLASGSNDKTALVWTVPANDGDKPPALDIEAKQAELLWEDLISADAAKAYQAFLVLSQVPKQSVPLLRERVQAVPPADAQKVAQLIADLDSNTFAMRKKAEDELEKLSELAEEALRNALHAKPSLEVKMRLQALLDKLEPGLAPNPQQLRILRALEVLETAGTPEAQEVLKAVAKGASRARVTKDAQAALDRLGKQ